MSKIFDHVKAIADSAARLRLDNMEVVASCITVLGHAAIADGFTDKEIMSSVAEQLERIRTSRLVIEAERHGKRADA